MGPPAFVLNCVNLVNSNPFYEFRAMLHSTREGQVLRTRCAAEVYRDNIHMNTSLIHRHRAIRLKLSGIYLIDCVMAQVSSSSVFESGCNGCKLYHSPNIPSKPCFTSLRAGDTIFTFALKGE